MHLKDGKAANATPVQGWKDDSGNTDEHWLVYRVGNAQVPSYS